MPAFAAEFGMPVRVDLVSSAPRKSERFYRAILGWSYMNTTPVHESAREAAQGRRVAMLSGMPVSVLLDAGPSDEGTTANQWRVSFHVDSVVGTVAKAQELGATVLQAPVELVDGSFMAVIADPAGALISLLEQPGEQVFMAAGEPGVPVWFELLAGADEGFDEVIDFYHGLFGWEIAVRNKTQDSTYAVVLEGGAPFAGMVSGPAGSTTTVGWVAYLGVEDIEAAVNKAEELGGSVITAPQVTEFGPVATISDPCGATVILCEVPPAPDEDVSETDDLFDLDMSQFN